MSILNTSIFALWNQSRSRWCAVVFAITCALFSGGATIACSCVWVGAFTEVMNGQEFVVRARVVEYGESLSHSETTHANMRVEIVEHLRGDRTVSELTILGDPGHLCLVYISETRFEIGQEYLLAVQRIGSGEAPLNACGEYWMRVDGDMAHGHRRADGEFESYTLLLDDIRDKIVDAPKS